MKLNKTTLAAAAIGIGATIGFAGQSYAQAATTTATPSATSSAAASTATDAPAASTDTPVTGTPASKAAAAVKAKDSAVTVTSVRMDPDGSYDVLGTKAGAPIMFDVSADFATVTQSAGGGGRGGHGGGGSADTPVTGAEATKIGAAVTAKDSAVTVTSVRMDPDGSYDVLGTKAGAAVFYDVSKDLTTITLNAGGGGHGGAAASGTTTPAA